MAQRQLQHAQVTGGEEPVDRVAVFRQHLAANEVPHEHGNEGNGERGTRRHGIGFSESQGGEHAPFLRLQRKHRHETHGDDQQSKEQRRAHLGSGIRHNAPAVLGCERCALHVLVHVFDHHNCAVDHGTNGNRNAAQRHDVGVQPLPVHDGKGGQNSHRQADNGHQ